MRTGARSAVVRIVAALVVLSALALGLAPVSGAAPSRGSFAEAARAGSASPRQRLDLVFPLVADEAGLRRFAQDVSTPGSPAYGQYASIAWLSRHFGATTITRTRVTRFLRRAGARHVRVDATGLFIDATLPAGRAQTLFSTSLARFHAARGSVYTAPATPVSVPRALRGLITGVIGLDTRRVATAPALLHGAAAIGSTAHAAAGVTSGYEPVTGTPSGCASGLSAGGFAPNQYLTAYDYDPLHAANDTGQGERVALIEIDGFRQGDISTFARCFGQRLPQINAFGIGDIKQALPPGGESTLDLEVLDSAAPGLRSIDVYESDAEASDVLMALTAPLQNSSYKPQIISASLGLCEASTEEAIGRSGINTSEASLQEAAASGITVLAASGDDGSSDCVSSSSTSSLPLATLAVNYPASSVWATGVGGTNLSLTPANVILSQEVWNDGSEIPGAAGGGGTSALFKRPTYQTGTVLGSQREVPDVALLADVAPGFDVYCTAKPACVSSGSPDAWQTVGGTSAATPLLAGGFAVVDEMLRNAKLQSLGLVNPLLYSIGRTATQAAQVFQDVTVGSNDVGPYIRSSARALGCCTAGVGYDEASGWGGVNLDQFAAVALVTQPKIVDLSLSVPGGQRPARSRHILTNVTCTGACLLGAFAKVVIGRSKPFTDYSNLYHLAMAGTKMVKISFSSAQLAKLRTAVANGARVRATIVGAIVDAGGNIERQTASQELKITA